MSTIEDAGGIDELADSFFGWRHTSDTRSTRLRRRDPLSIHNFTPHVFAVGLQAVA